MSWQGITGITMGAIGLLAVGLAVFTGGASIGVGTAIILALDAASAGTGIASAILEEKDPQKQVPY